MLNPRIALYITSFFVTCWRDEWEGQEEVVNVISRVNDIHSWLRDETLGLECDDADSEAPETRHTPRHTWKPTWRS